jgi:hypothetical protein
MLLCRAAAAPTPATCEDWATRDECTNNPTFMWSECAAACKSRGLEEPWAKLDAQALAAPPANASVLELSFAAGSFSPLRIVLRADLSPQTVAAVVAAVGERREGSVTFYRNEAVPTSPPGQCGSILCRPYSLVQGRLAALSNTPAEGQPKVRRGHVARIQNGADFFIALDDHSEWGHAFTVWGELHDASGLATLEAITRLPYHEQAGAGGTIMRLLDVEAATQRHKPWISRLACR